MHGIIILNYMRISVCSAYSVVHKKFSKGFCNWLEN